MSDEELKQLSKQAVDDEHKALGVLATLAQMDRTTEEYRHVRSQLKALVPPGIYELHKSTPENVKRYVVLGIADETEGEKRVFVDYSALYAPHQGELANRVLVGVGGFLTPVPRGEFFVPRFRFIRRLNTTVSEFLANA